MRPTGPIMTGLALTQLTFKLVTYKFGNFGDLGHCGTCGTWGTCDWDLEDLQLGDLQLGLGETCGASGTSELEI